MALDSKNEESSPINQDNLDKNSLNKEEFILHFNDLLYENIVFSQMSKDERAALLEKLFVRLDVDKSGSVEVCTLLFFSLLSLFLGGLAFKLS